MARSEQLTAYLQSLLQRQNPDDPGQTVPDPNGQVPPPQPPFKPGNYTFTLVNMQIFNTRSRHADSNKLVLSGALGSATPQTVTKDLGNQNNGTFDLGLSVGPFYVSDPNIGLSFHYTILNSGHQDWAKVNNDLSSMGNMLASKGATAATTAIGGLIGAGVAIGSVIVPVIGSILAAAFGLLVNSVVSLIVADCDGPVAAEQPTFKGQDVWNRSNYGPTVFGNNTFHPGQDSPHGCGSNSQYGVYWQISRS